MPIFCSRNLVLIVILLGSISFQGVSLTSHASQPKVVPAPSTSVLVDVTTSTFKTRGRLFYDVEGTIIKKLTSSGLRAVRDSTLSYQYILEGRYEERRGEEFDIGRWGTTIVGEFVFRKKHGEVLWRWNVHEVSTNAISGAPPYIDALLKFATHPYFFSLGPICHELTQPGGSIPAVMTRSLRERVAKAYPLPSENDPGASVDPQDHFMDAIHVVHQDMAFQRTFDELIREKVSKGDLLPIAQRFLQSSDPQLRLRGVRVLGQTSSNQDDLRQLAMNDPNREVRAAAQTFLSPTSSLP